MKYPTIVAFWIISNEGKNDIERQMFVRLDVEYQGSVRQLIAVLKAQAEREGLTSPRIGELRITYRIPSKRHIKTVMIDWTDFACKVELERV